MQGGGGNEMKRDFGGRSKEVWPWAEPQQMSNEDCYSYKNAKNFDISIGARLTAWAWKKIKLAHKEIICLFCAKIRTEPRGDFKRQEVVQLSSALQKLSNAMRSFLQPEISGRAPFVDMKQRASGPGGSRCAELPRAFGAGGASSAVRKEETTVAKSTSAQFSTQTRRRRTMRPSSPRRPSRSQKAALLLVSFSKERLSERPDDARPEFADDDCLLGPIAQGREQKGWPKRKEAQKPGLGSGLRFLRRARLGSGRSASARTPPAIPKKNCRRWTPRVPGLVLQKWAEHTGGDASKLLGVDGPATKMVGSR